MRVWVALVALGIGACAADPGGQPVSSGEDAGGTIDSGGGSVEGDAGVDAGRDVGAGAPLDSADAPGDVADDTGGDAGGADGAVDTSGPLPLASGPINGWILLDADPVAVAETIDAAAALGVNHIQLSHDLIMNIEDVLPGADGADVRVQTLNDAIARAHSHGMKAYVWAHEISGSPPNPAPCWGPDGDFWAERAEAYRQGIARIPDVDGVILMFGSAPVSPWIAICSCAWCDGFTDGGPWDHPPQAMKLQLITEHVGGAIVGLGKELFIRTFIHEPVEVAWHSQGLSASTGVPFVGMHKGAAQDWQPYNPPDPNIGHIGDHAAVVELDLAGEYQGLSELPFVSPGYFRMRMQPVAAAGGIGAVARVQRGSHHALGTPNEVNLRAVSAWSLDPTIPLDQVWGDSLAAMYGVQAGPEQAALRRVLEHTFAIRLKSHYALGVWALEKSSDIPSEAKMAELNDRGNLPEWDPDWQPVWDRVASPNREAVEWIWQEGTEAVELAARDMTATDTLQSLSSAHRKDLQARLTHQWWAARAWRAVDLLLFGRKALSKTPDDLELAGWVRWAHDELQTVANGMTADGLQGVSVASPARLMALHGATASLVPADVEPLSPDTHLFSPLEIVALSATEATLRFTTRRPVTVTAEWGAELPDYGHTLELGVVEADTPTDLLITGLSPHSRWVVRVTAVEGGADRRGGDWWVFTP